MKHLTAGPKTLSPWVGRLKRQPPRASQSEAFLSCCLAKTNFYRPINRFRRSFRRRPELRSRAHLHRLRRSEVFSRRPPKPTLSFNLIAYRTRQLSQFLAVVDSRTGVRWSPYSVAAFIIPSTVYLDPERSAWLFLRCFYCHRGRRKLAPEHSNVCSLVSQLSRGLVAIQGAATNGGGSLSQPRFAKLHL